MSSQPFIITFRCSTEANLLWATTKSLIESFAGYHKVSKSSSLPHYLKKYWGHLTTALMVWKLYIDSSNKRMSLLMNEKKNIGAKKLSARLRATHISFCRLFSQYQLFLTPVENPTNVKGCKSYWNRKNFI